MPTPTSRDHCDILVADDESSLRELLLLVLGTGGRQVLAAHDGHQALALLRRYQPRLIVLDLNMPGLGGHDVLQWLRDSPSHAAIPVIVLSGELPAIPERIPEQFSVYGMLAKPFALQDLLALALPVVKTPC